MAASPSKRTALLLLVAATFCAIEMPKVLVLGKNADGVEYAAIARNMAEGRGTFWKPYLSDHHWPVHYEQPPLIYGIQAAKLAGLPQPVIARAFEVLKHLEQQRDEKPAGHFADDLPLFSVRAMALAPAERAPDALRLRLVGLDPDQVSAREALNLLYELKALSGKDGGET